MRPQDTRPRPSGSSLLVTALLAALLFGGVAIPVAFAWQRHHEAAEDDRHLAATRRDLDRAINDAKLGNRYAPAPYAERPAPLPAREPIVTGLAVAVGVFVLFAAGASITGADRRR